MKYITMNQAIIACFTSTREMLPEFVGKKPRQEYRLDDRLGSGSLRVVYVGTNTYGGKKVAVKFD